ncbi:MAG: phosphoenolpyruvate carboxylase [Candidatus Sumerlaeia bacterium]|nr:phosphoenolpyruvate carboxylase [Candidatus Sumerlaeia bacterium]
METTDPASNAAATSDVLWAAAFDKIGRDYRMLLEHFARVLRELGEDRLAGCVDLVLRDPAPGEPPLAAPGSTRELQVLSIAFQLLNLVEENTAAQMRRAREALPSERGEPGLWRYNLEELRRAGHTPDRIAAALRDVHVEPVLTAHPTEAKRPTVLALHRQLYLHLVSLENRMWTHAEREEIHREIRETLERLWRTGETYLEKPDVLSELENALHYLREVFPAALGKVDQRLDQAWEALGWGSPLVAAREARPRLGFGTWVGGDRDGHPLVTPEVTRSTLARLRSEARIVLERQLEQLAARLTLSAHLQPVPEALTARIEELAALIPAPERDAAARHAGEPWRQAALLLRARVAADGYTMREELSADLQLLDDTLVAVGARRLARGSVQPVQRVFDTFGLHLASLDLRQNSAFHDRAMEQILAASGVAEEGYSRWNEEMRLAFLEEELLSRRPFLPRRAELGEEARSVLGALAVVAEHWEKHGGEGVGSYIVSMTRDVSDLLVVYLFQREVGLVQSTPEGLRCLLPVVPLFETVGDLRRSPAVLRGFLAHPVTARSLPRARSGEPVVQLMVGYSDSNKDGGIVAAQWGLNRAQSELAEAAREAGALPRFFHGRGGTTSRGAGPLHRFLGALAHGSLAGGFRMTEQGETVAQNYANLITCTYNLELLLSGVTAATLRHAGPPSPLDAELAPAMEALAAASTRAYRELIEAPGFIDYYSHATPIDALEHSTIGSRPARRTSRRTLEDLRAIPWVFSWNQSRHYLPGWYGLGSGLAHLEREQPSLFASLMEKGRLWPFLRNVLYNVETSLASASLEIAGEYAALVPDEAVRAAIHGRIEDEWRLAGAMIDRVFHRSRAERRPRMIRTVALRDAGLRRLHTHQVGLLRAWRAARSAGDEKGAAELLPPLLLSINAIASGERTTG